MAEKIKTEDIIEFLVNAKELVALGKYDFVPRRKNMQSLASHGLTLEDAKSVIFELTVADYYKGPKRDLDSNRPGYIWEFKKTIDNFQFYIKVKIVCEENENILKCIGFHEDEFV